MSVLDAIPGGNESVIGYALKELRPEGRSRIDELEARLRALEAQVRRLREVMQ